MNIVLDFDYTLFNTEEFKQALRDRLALFGISARQFDNSYQVIKREINYYNHKEHLKILAQKNGLNENDLLLGFQEVIDATKEFLYPDTISFLETLKKIPKSTLFLLTFGQDEFQQAKIEASGIKKYFEKIIDTTESKLKFIEVNGNLSNLVLINDRGKEIDEVKQQFPAIKAIWLRRTHSPYQKESCQWKDFEATSLSEVLSFIKTFIK